MIDEALDTEFEDRLRATLAEMIPKLVTSEAAVSDHPAAPAADELLTRRSTPQTRPSRRLAVAAVAVAATILGLIAIARRDTGDQVPGDNSSTTDAGPPAWYDLIAPSLPENFQHVALTLATDVQLFFVAINPVDGKTLEIQIASGGYSAEPSTTVDTTGAWVETAQGWSVQTPAGLFVSVSCDIGVGGRDYVGTENYCDFTNGILPFTKDEIRAVANSLATALDVSIFSQKLGAPSGDTIDTDKATALISAAVPGQGIRATDLGKGADHIYDAGAGIGTESPSDTLPPLDVVQQLAGTSVRILHGVYPLPPATGEPVIDLYDKVAVVSMFGPGGVYVRIGTTDSSPESVTRLGQLARDLLALDPAAADAEAAVAVPSSTIPPNEPLTCGTDVPAHIEVPGAIGGMEIGSDVNTEYLTTQFVAHWTTSTGVIEMRWPPDQRRLYADGPSPSSELFDTSISMQIPQDTTQPSAISAVEPGGAYRSTIEIANGDVPATAGCGLLQFTVRRFTGEQVTFGWDLRGRPQFVTDIRPLITSSSSVTTVPSEPISCQGAAALGGPVTDPFAYPSSAEALQGFLQSPVAERLVKSGYTEMKAPDASVVYGRDFGQGFVTLITARHGDSGWSVIDWRASSC